MKKTLFFLIFMMCAYAGSIEYYLFSVKFDYKEYSSSGAYLDGESSNFGDLNGIGIKYYGSDTIKYFLKGEFAYGKTKYDGSTWGGTPLSLTKENSYLYNIEGGLFPYRNPFYLSLGYRFWNRGKSDYAGDYDEQYYWGYLGFGYYYFFNINASLSLSADVAYQYAFNPKLDVYLGSGTTLDLGTTDGIRLQISGYYNYQKDLIFTLMYRYQYWHINRSAPGVVNNNGTVITVVEPESFTRNQYLGVGLLYKF